MGDCLAGEHLDKDQPGLLYLPVRVLMEIWMGNRLAGERLDKDLPGLLYCL